jgi:hypothetical protein
VKKINSILAGLLLTASLLLTQQATAQSPQRMSYQSVIRNSSNVLLANTAVGIRISVLQGSATGTAVYVETQTATTNGNGLLSLQIGTGTATIGTFAGINWAAGPYFIKTETDPAGGTNYTITGTQEMLSVPYALYAETSGGQGGVTTAGSGIDVTGAGTVVSPYVVSATSPCGLAIGQTYQGGIIFYLDPSGCHGLISSSADQSSGIQWYNGSFFATNATFNGVKAGQSNTRLIVDAQGSGSYAAQLCNDLITYTNDGLFEDWYLPSRSELYLMRQNIGQGNALGLGNVGSFSGNSYWNSTEGGTTNAGTLDFSNGTQNFYIQKNLIRYVRAVRAF